MFTKRYTNGLIYYTSPLFDRLGIKHMFATRLGGVSSGAFDSLNVSTARKDENGRTDTRNNVEKNYRLALNVLDAVPENSCATKQVHSNTVAWVGKERFGKGILADYEEPDSCDGIITTPDSGVRALCVKTADCVPILLKNTATGSICAVHAGWRGTASDIVGNAVTALSDGNPENIVAAIGPAIGSCCYKVGNDVVYAFEVLFKSKNSSFDLSSIISIMPSCSVSTDTYLDLAKANKALLMLSGVKPENIDVSDICTCCYTDNGIHPFFSHRGSGGYSGTFVSAIRV